jgi:hypothetical protein
VGVLSRSAGLYPCGQAPVAWSADHIVVGIHVQEENIVTCPLTQSHDHYTVATSLPEEPMETTAASFSQVELCEAAGIDHETANNWIKRGLLETTAVGGRKMRGRRLFSMLEIYKAHLMNEAITYLGIPPSHCAEIASRAIAAFVKAEKLTRIDDDHEPAFAIALVARQNGKWITDLRFGSKALFSSKEAQQVNNPLAILPISEAFTAIHRRCAKFLRTSSESR